MTWPWALARLHSNDVAKMLGAFHRFEPCSAVPRPKDFKPIIESWSWAEKYLVGDLERRAHWPNLHTTLRERPAIHGLALLQCFQGDHQRTQCGLPTGRFPEQQSRMPWLRAFSTQSSTTQRPV